MDTAPTFNDADHGTAVNGLEYKDFLSAIHDELVPESYFEIGTSTGVSLALANCVSVAVDPEFKLSSDVFGTKPACFLFQETSDDFFMLRNLSAIVGGAIDLAFLDGMHLAEFLLRDFMNTERHCRRNSIVVLHDCLPPGYRMTTRDQDDPRRKLSKYPDYWTGDVWQVVPILQRFRPDLSITLIDSLPTGLVVITGLDPANDVLASAYQEIFDEHLPSLAGRTAYDAYWANVRIVPTAPFLADLLQTHTFGPDPDLTSAAALAPGGLHRNAPCPCGSGKKFKHCHGRLA